MKAALQFFFKWKSNIESPVVYKEPTDPLEIALDYIRDLCPDLKITLWEGSSEYRQCDEIRIYVAAEDWVWDSPKGRYGFLRYEQGKDFVAQFEMASDKFIPRLIKSHLRELGFKIRG